MGFKGKVVAPWIDVTAYGAKGDLVADSTSAFEQALAFAGSNVQGAAGPVVYVPVGRYRISRPLILPAGVSMRGDGIFATELHWDGLTTDTFITRPGTKHNGVSAMRIEEGNTRPACYIAHTGTYCDFGDDFSDLYLGNISATDGIAQLRLPTIINCYLNSVRFGGGRGYAIEVIQGDGATFRALSLDGFTIDHTDSGGALWQGFIHVVLGSSNADLSIALRDGRMEGSAGGMGSPGALITVESNPPNSLSERPLDVVLDNVQIQAPYTALVNQVTTQTVVATYLSLRNCRVRDVVTALTGLWGITKPQKPDGIINHWSIGRRRTGTSNHNKNQLNDVAIGGDGTNFMAAILTGTATWDPPNILALGSASTTVTVTGAALGDVAIVGFSRAISGAAILSATVSAADTVSVTLYNNTGAAFDLASGTLRVWVIKQS